MREPQAARVQRTKAPQAQEGWATFYPAFSSKPTDSSGPVATADQRVRAISTGHPVKEATSCSVGERESRNDSQSPQRSGLGAHRRGLFYSDRSVRQSAQISCPSSLRGIRGGWTHQANKGGFRMEGAWSVTCARRLANAIRSARIDSEKEGAAGKH